MRFDVFTIFPNMIQNFSQESILKRAQTSDLIDIQVHDIRNWTTDRHRSVDDYPYGGGAGMVMMAPPILSAVEDVLDADEQTEIIILTPSGEQYNQRVAEELSTRKRLALICGRYEGIDERVTSILRARPISIGDFVVTGGELAAAVIIDSVSRLIPGVIDTSSTEDESHTDGLLEYPQYTRPYSVRGEVPPDVLLSGHHARIIQWRRQQALLRTLQRRPDLIDSAELSNEDRAFLMKQQHEPS